MPRFTMWRSWDRPKEALALKLSDVDFKRATVTIPHLKMRIRVEKVLEPALKKLGIAGQPHYERRISRTTLIPLGCADVMYARAQKEAGG